MLVYLFIYSFPEIHSKKKQVFILSNHLLCFFLKHSARIRTVVGEKYPIEAVGDDLLCTACEMTVIWMQNQLRQSMTKEKVINYVNQVFLIHILTSFPESLPDKATRFLF